MVSEVGYVLRVPDILNNKMNDLRGPGELNFETTNLSESWAKWKRSMQYYLVATCKDKSEDEKVAIFMCMIGRQGQDIKDTFEFAISDRGEEIVTVTILFEKFEQYCKSRKNLIVERHRFLTRNQEQSETIDPTWPNSRLWRRLVNGETLKTI